ncbi:uncharacterized protein [Linepithema humile]|uniref:uncharacterized protein n=1 Tax=Linepithema humile TaxID=83485 RepID=UPI00351E86CC
MPKRKNYEHLSRSQQWRRRQEIDKKFTINETNNKEIENENPQGESHKNIDIRNISMENDVSQDVEDFGIDSYSEDSDVESDLDDKHNDEVLNCYPQKEATLREFLRSWSIENNITHVAITKLLKGLKAYGHEDLPTEARTLLQTPQTTSMINTASGTYYYHGLKRALEDHLKHTRSVNIENPIRINLGIDGLPLAKSSKAQFWPLLGQIVHIDYREEPFVIGVYHGYCKPGKPDEIIDNFIEEYTEIEEEGFNYEGKNYEILINTVICDAPARAFMKCIKSHTGYYGCDKCEEEGEWINGRMLFLNKNAPLRTDETFLLRQNEDHHLDNSPFENIALKMVTQFPLDYMHLVCLGVMKKLTKLWITGIRNVKLSASEIHKLSDDLKQLIPYIPKEFSRKPRGLNELDRWKATKFRLFLLYTGLVTLTSYLPNDYLRHFYVLHCAISILCNPTDCKYNNKYANELLIHFVQAYKLLYGEQYITYNVHNLIHLHKDVQNYGCLDMFSAFPFENYFKEMKKMLRKSAQPLQQLHRRLMEKSYNGRDIIYEYQQYPILLNSRNKELLFGCTYSYREIKFKNFSLSCIREADAYCYIDHKHIVMIEYIGKRNGEIVIVGKTLQNSSNIPLYPCDSRQLGIHIRNIWSEIGIYPVSKISAKAMRLPYKVTFCIIPIIHTDN